MQSIETTQIDQYAQGMLRDRSLTPQERALSASLAMRMHVLTEHGLPVQSPLPLSQEDEERVYWQEDHLERVADSATQALMEKSFEAFEWIEDQYTEEPQIVDGLLKLATEVMEMEQHEVTNHDGRVLRVFEGNSPFYSESEGEA